jgi:ABC-type glycerol-3-phosphate transport system substrate-binding protein
MKTKFSAFILAALIGLVAIAATNSTSDYQTATPFYAYSVTDTITDGENDTIEIPTRLVSKWTSLYHVNVSSLSGTVGLSNILQEAASYGSTDWVQVDSINHTAAAVKRLDNEVIYGPRQRLIIDGSGTQSTRYTIHFFAKKD